MTDSSDLRVVHSTPSVPSTSRMHVMEEDCWCDPYIMECFSERLVAHHDEGTDDE